MNREERLKKWQQKTKVDEGDALMGQAKQQGNRAAFLEGLRVKKRKDNVANKERD